MYEPIKGTAIIGVGHRARQGKDSAARAMISLMPKDVMRFAFADDLYAVARVVHGMREKDPALLQRLGTEVYRAVDDEVWVRSVYYKIKEANPPIAIITDVRFPNEANFVRQLGGITLRVQRVKEDGVTAFVAPDRNPKHASEIALNPDHWWDDTITNVSGKAVQFDRAVEEWLWRFLGTARKKQA